MYETNISNTVTNPSLVYGIEVHDWISPKWGKIVWKINSAGNLTIECSPSLTPGVLPSGVEPGRVPAGVRLIDYDKKIIYSINFDDCLAISEMSKRRFDYDDNGQPIKPTNIKSVILFRNSNKFNKKLNISYNDGGNGTYLVNWQFECVDATGISNKFKIPMNLEAFDNIAKLFETFANNYFMIKYYHSVEMDKINGGNK